MAVSKAVPTPSAISTADVEALTGLKRPRQQQYVLAVAAGMTREAAARQAGYRGTDAAYRVGKVPAVAAALQIVRAELARRAQYTLDRLVTDLDDAADFARETENATALVRARELKGRALGLLVDRVDARVQQVPFRIEISGIDHRPALEVGPDD